MSVKSEMLFFLCLPARLPKIGHNRDTETNAQNGRQRGLNALRDTTSAGKGPVVD